MAEIVSGLFGVNPQQLAAERQATDTANAFKFANLDNMGRAQMAIYQGGAGLGRAASGLLGGDPEMEKVSAIKSLSNQFDLTSATGMREFARSLQQQFPQEAMMAAKRADEMQSSTEKSGLTAAQTRQAEAGKVIQVDLGDRIQLVNALTNEVIREVPKGLTPGQAAKAAGGSEGGVFGGGVNNNGVPTGTFDKTGRYKSPTGRVYTARAVDDAQASHDNAQDLLDRLQNVTEEDVKNAYGSFADYTTMTGGKLVAPTSTLNAQTKINEIGIRSVLTNLQQLKGATSDKEMNQMIKDFPGYQSSPDIMRNWIQRATRVTNKFLARGEKRFGFDTEYAQEGRFATTKQGTDKKTSSDDELVNKYLNPKK